MKMRRAAWVPVLAVPFLVLMTTLPARATNDHNGWRWFPDSTADPTTGDAFGAQSENIRFVAPIGERLRLRVGIDPGEGVAGLQDWSLLMTTVDAETSGWVRITTTTDRFCLFNGKAGAGDYIQTRRLSAPTLSYKYVEDVTNNKEFDNIAGTVEWDFAIESTGTGAAAGEVYSFGVGWKNNVHPIGTGYPRVTIATTDQTNAFNFLRHRAEEGTYATPVPNMNASYQTLLLPVGRTDYAGASQGDTLYALSRTNGAVRWSLAQSGRVRGIRRAWSTRDNAYRVFTVVDGCMLSAMLDTNGGFTSVSGWATNPKPFGSSSAFPISDPMIVSETNHLGGTSYYLYIIATTFQSASSSLWKIQADDGQLDSDNGDWPFGPTDTGASTRGWSTTAGLNWQGSVFWVTGISDGKSYRVSHSPVSVTSFQGTSGPTDMQLPPHIDSSSVLGKVYLSPVDTFVWKIRSDTMATPSANSWDGGSSSSNRSSTMVSTNTCSPFGAIGAGGTAAPDIFAAVNNKVYALQGTDGDIMWNPGGIQVSGGPSTGMARRGAFLYFGTDTGWMYKMSATNGTVPTGWPWGAPGSPKVVGCAIDNNKNGPTVFFTTDDGRLYCFDP